MRKKTNSKGFDLENIVDIESDTDKNKDSNKDKDINTDKDIDKNKDINKVIDKDKDINTDKDIDKDKDSNKYKDKDSDKDIDIDIDGKEIVAELDGEEETSLNGLVTRKKHKEQLLVHIPAPLARVTRKWGRKIGKLKGGQSKLVEIALREYFERNGVLPTSENKKSKK